MSGLKQAYLRTSSTPAGLGIAFEKAVRHNPHGTALLFEDQKFSYEALNEWANQIGTIHLLLGAQKGDVRDCGDGTKPSRADRYRYRPGKNWRYLSFLVKYLAKWQGPDP